MRYKYLSFPHPVLGVKDDINGVYSVTFAWQPGIEYQTLIFENLLINPSLESLVKDKKAGYLVEIHCPDSLYRNAFIEFKNQFILKIPTDKLLNKVIVNCFIVSTEKNNDYHNNKANADYSGYKFNIYRGDILAVNKNRFEFIAEKTYENYFRISSFIEIVPGKFDAGPITFRLTQEKIYIEMSKNDYYKKYAFYRVNTSLYPVFHSSLAFPALIFALNKMRDNDDDKSSAWYQKLEERLNQDEELKELDVKTLSNLPEIAQILLKNPISRIFSGFDKLNLTNKREEE